jgi:hypothetical protein
MLSEEALKEFQKIYKEEYGVDIDETTAEDLGYNLLVLFSHIYKPVKKEWVEKLDEQEKEKSKRL